MCLRVKTGQNRRLFDRFDKDLLIDVVGQRLSNLYENGLVDLSSSVSRL